MENVLPAGSFSTLIWLCYSAPPARSPARPPARSNLWEILSFSASLGCRCRRRRTSISTAPGILCLSAFYESPPRSAFLAGVTAQCAYRAVRSARWISPPAPRHAVYTATFLSHRPPQSQTLDFSFPQRRSVRVSRATDLALRLKQLIFLACVLAACITGCLSANLHLGAS